MTNAGTSMDDSSTSLEEMARPTYWHQRAVDRSLEGDFLDAATFFRHAIVLDSEAPLLRYDLGVALYKAGSLADADSAFSEASRLDPLWKEPSTIRVELTAKQRELQKSQSDFAKPNRGDTDFGKPLYSPNGSFALDVAACQALLIDVDQIWPLHQANTVHQFLASSQAANPALWVAVACRLAGVREDDESQTRVWRTISDGHAAKRFVLDAIKLRPNHETLLAGAQVLQSLGEVSHALVIAERCLHENPHDASAQLVLAELLLQDGKLKQGGEMLERLLASNSNHPRAGLLFAGLPVAYGPGTSGKHPDVNQDLTGHDWERRRLASGWQLERADRFEEAFDVYLQVHEHRQQRRSANEASLGDPFDHRSIMTTIDRGFIDARRDWGVSSEKPVFVVGLPHSGTCTVEQILASHPDCHGAGELADLQVLDRLIEAQFATPVLDSTQATSRTCGIANMPKSVCHQLAQSHVQALSVLDPQARFVVDRMPTNYALLGLIEILFPQARIIHCRRNMLDIATDLIRQPTRYWTFRNLNDLADKFQAYQALMDHWNRVLSLRILEVPYEELVTGYESAVKSIAEFCDLTWTSSPLNANEIRRLVWSLGELQFQRPLHVSNNGFWKKHENQLRGLFSLLKTSP